MSTHPEDEKKLRVWDVWKEVDPRIQRFVQIEDLRAMVAIRTVVLKDGRWVAAPKSRVSYAHAERFNGKRGGYALHWSSPHGR